MFAMKKCSLMSAFLVAVLFVGLVFIGSSRLKTARASTDVIGVIGSNTTWTRAESPYELAGPVRVDSGVTLTVEPGAVVNLNGFYILVEGTLSARGTNNDSIHFNGGSNVSPNYAITFASSSTDWNEKKTVGCIVDNAVVSSILINDSSPIIRNCNISAFYAIDINEGSAQIVNNSIKGQIGIHAGTPLIANNTIFGEINVAYSAPLIVNNTIKGDGQQTGIAIAGNASVTGNIIYGYQTAVYAVYGNSKIEKNLIIYNVDGLVVGDPEYDYPELIAYYEIDIGSGFNVTIRNNAIVNNSIGINITYYSPKRQYPALNVNATPTIINNNIQDNANFSIYLDSQLSLNATKNWWGTTDPEAINQTIYDNKRDFNLATVIFTPFLTASNPEAPTAQTPVDYQKPSPSNNSADENQPLSEMQILEIVVVILVVVIVALSIVIVNTRRKRRTATETQPKR